MNYIQYMGLMRYDKLVPTKYYKNESYYKPNDDGSHKVAYFIRREPNNSTIVVTVDGKLSTYSIDHWKPVIERGIFIQKLKAIINVIREDRHEDWGEQ